MAQALTTDDSRQRRDLDHLKLLAIFHFVLAGLILLGIGFLVLHYLFMRTVFQNPAMFKAQGNAPFSPNDVMRILIAFYFVFGCLFVIASALNVVCGVFLLRRKYRSFSIVIAAMDCLFVPLGTALGVFTIVVLCRESVVEAYGAPLPIDTPGGVV